MTRYLKSKVGLGADMKQDARWQMAGAAWRNSVVNYRALSSSGSCTHIRLGKLLLSRKNMVVGSISVELIIFYLIQ